MNKLNIYNRFEDAIKGYRSVALLCNQTAFDFKSGKYLFEQLSELDMLKKVFIPEHGLFAELQDQVPLDSASVYSKMGAGVEFVSLYQSSEKNLRGEPGYFKDIDALIICLQDVGCRYYTFITTISYLFQTIAENEIDIDVCIIDKPNPGGRRIEGTILKKEYSSFVGVDGLLNRYGLTIGELCLFLREKSGGNFRINIIAAENPFSGFDVQPSPNIPDTDTVLLYGGQCLFEGTVLSEGRGTTAPFKIIGAPFMDWMDLKRIKSGVDKICSDFNCLRQIELRPLFFIPVFHKHANLKCGGFQLHLTGKKFHSLLYSIVLLRQIHDFYKDINIWREGKYESGSEKTAIEILAGDKIILDYLYGKGELASVIEALNKGEKQWMASAGKYRIYDQPFELVLF